MWVEVVKGLLHVSYGWKKCLVNRFRNELTGFKIVFFH